MGDQEAHDAVCGFVCDKAVDRCWARVRQHEKVNEVTHGLWDQFGTVARNFKTIPMSSTRFGVRPPSNKSLILFDSSTCWASTAPSAADLNKYAMSEINSSSADYDQSLQVVHQLQRRGHRPAEVEFILSLAPPYILTRYPFRLPSWLGDQWTDAKGGVLMDATPKFTCLDLHCDRGISTVTVPLGSMVGLWLIWPPNEHNNRLFYAAKEECTRTGMKCVERIGTQLTDGVIVLTDHTHALYVPSGYIKLFYTLEGGYLTGMSFSGREDLPSFVACVEQEVRIGSDVEDLKNTIKFLLEALERSLLSIDTRVVFSTASLWMRVMQAMKDAAGRGLNWAGMPSLIHQTLIRCRIGNPIVVEQGCPCGQLVKGPFFRHFITHRL